MKCPKCKIYTMKPICPICGEKTIMARPPKFSLEDKYAKYRREIKREELKNEGLI